MLYEGGGTLHDAAEAGELKIDPEIAQDAVDKVGKVRDKLQELARSLSGYGGQTLQLGDNPVGHAMARKSEDRYVGDNSLRAAVAHLQKQADLVHIALQKAMENYVATDRHNAYNMRDPRAT